MSYTYKYPHFAVTVDVVVQCEDCLLLIQRKNLPFQHWYALPGGYVNIDETLYAAARRELQEETGLVVPYLEYVSFYDALHRDSRERTITHVWYATVGRDQFWYHGEPHGGDDALSANWHNFDDLPHMALAFDHRRIIEDTLTMYSG